jgi:hypothetical protein
MAGKITEKGFNFVDFGIYCLCRVSQKEPTICVFTQPSCEFYQCRVGPGWLSFEQMVLQSIQTGQTTHLLSKLLEAWAM